MAVSAADAAAAQVHLGKGQRLIISKRQAAWVIKEEFTKHVSVVGDKQ
jgi:hypothetical protein